MRKSIDESGALFFTKSSLGENAAVLAGTSGTRPQRHVVELASMALCFGRRAASPATVIHALALASEPASGTESAAASGTASAAASGTASACAQIKP